MLDINTMSEHEEAEAYEFYHHSGLHSALGEEHFAAWYAFVRTLSNELFIELFRPEEPSEEELEQMRAEWELESLKEEEANRRAFTAWSEGYASDPREDEPYLI